MKEIWATRRLTRHFAKPALMQPQQHGNNHQNHLYQPPSTAVLLSGTTAAAHTLSRPEMSDARARRTLK